MSKISIWKERKVYFLKMSHFEKDENYKKI